MEAITYRWRGHVGPDENIDVGVRRSAEEVAAWRKRDPIARLRDALIESGSFSFADFTALKEAEAERIEAAISAALLANFPTKSTVLDCVYSS